MNRQMTCGTSSISFQNPVFVQSCASVVSQKEGEGPLGAYFDTICEDPMFGTDYDCSPAFNGAGCRSDFGGG